MSARINIIKRDIENIKSYLLFCSNHILQLQQKIDIWKDRISESKKELKRLKKDLRKIK